MDKKENNFCLDKVFREKTDYTAFAFDVYSKIYNLPKIKYHGEVSSELFEYCLKRKYFILLAVYDEEGDIYLERNIQENLFWSLPGGSIQKNEDIHAAVKRISSEISEDNKIEIALGEIEPIAFVENTFSFKGEACCHFGLAFSGRIRNKQKVNFHDAKGRFVRINQEELGNINRYANREVVRICHGHIKKFKTQPFEKEISTNEEVKWRYFIHDFIVKRFVLTPALKKKKKFLEMLSGEIADGKSLIDVSCGDNRIVSDLYDLKNFNYVVANDVSWGQINTKQREGRRMLFTNHNAAYLPFADNSFDVAICANTLHHLPTREDLFGLFGSCLRVAKKIVIIEIEDPRKTGFFHKLLNKYWYSWFLKDVGGSYFDKEAFYSSVNEFFDQGVKIDFKEFSNIQGVYQIAIVTKETQINSGAANDKIEVEDKFFLDDDNKKRLIDFCEREGFSEVGHNIEVDDYFSDICGEFVKNRTCLRLRSSNESSELTFKGKSSSLSSFYSKVEHNVPLSGESARSIKSFFPSLGYFKYATVVKNRRTMSREVKGYYENVSIDTLPGIGSFVEFEILAEPVRWISKKQELSGLLEQFIKKSGLPNLKRADQPYRDYVADFLSKSVLGKGSTKAFLFDFDGTIAKTENIFFTSFSRIAEKFSGKSIHMSDYAENELKEYDKLFDSLALSVFTNKNEFMALVYDDYREALKKHSFDDHLSINLSAINKIKKLGYKVGVVSSSRKEFVDIVLGDRCEDDFFDVRIHREDTEFTKPASDPYKKALDFLNFEPNACVAVEDSPRGIESAKKAGLKCAFCRGEILSEPAGEESYYFESLMEIALILENAK